MLKLELKTHGKDIKKKKKWRRWPWSIQMKLSWSKKWITTIGHIVCAVFQIKPCLWHIELKIEKKMLKWSGWERHWGDCQRHSLSRWISTWEKRKNRFLYAEMELDAKTSKKNQNKTKGHSQMLLNNVKLLPIALQNFHQLICSWY